MTPRQIELHIDELVLDGFDVRDQQRIGAALQSELQRLFTEQGIPASLTKAASLATVDGGQIKPGGSSPEIIAAQVAGNIYQGLQNTAASVNAGPATTSGKAG